MNRTILVLTGATLVVSALTLYIVVRVGLELDAKGDALKAKIQSNPLGKVLAPLLGIG